MAVIPWLIGAGAVWLAQHQLQNMINQTLNDLNWRGMMMDTTNQEIDVLVNDIVEKWEEYSMLHTEYDQTAQKQINYTIENTDPSIRQIVLVGVTGSGKSLFGNRLSGYQGDDDQNGYFSVSDDLDSVTQNISKLIVYNLHAVNISILDTPGIYDSKDNDMIHRHHLIEHLKGSGGVNAFLLIMKKDRFSQNIQKMLKDFHQTFGDEFWSHLIFVINFWNERERKNWEKWMHNFKNKIRAEFELTDAEKYPLHVVGLNNFGSYKQEIKQDLIPNIPSVRLTSDSFISPLDVLETKLLQKYKDTVELVNHWNQLEFTVNSLCSEFWELFQGSLIKLHLWIERKTFCELCENPYLSYVYKVQFEMEFSSDECNANGPQFLYDFINQFFARECMRVYPKMNRILSEMEQKKLGNPNTQSKENRALFQHGSINYNASDNLLYKYNYLMDEKDQNLLNCMNASGNLVDNNELIKSLDSILNERDQEKYTIICSKKCSDIAAKCKEDTQTFNLYDDGSRFVLGV